IFDGPAGGADQVVMMPRLAPDIGRHVTGTLQPLRQPGAHQPIQGAEYSGSPDVSVPLSDSLVKLLGGGLLAGLGQHAGNGEPLRRQPNTGLLEGRLGSCLNHTQMILAFFPPPLWWRVRVGGEDSLKPLVIPPWPPPWRRRAQPPCPCSGWQESGLSCCPPCCSPVWSPIRRSMCRFVSLCSTSLS